jgi:hypothetical protein
MCIVANGSAGQRAEEVLARTSTTTKCDDRNGAVLMIYLLFLAL